MGLRIRTNIASLNAQRRLESSTNSLRESFEKLASGQRINKSADDAAGLSISENLRADIRSLSMAKRNAADGISIVQTAEGALNEQTSILIRLRELSIQAASDTVGPQERTFIDREYVALKDEIDRIANSAEFNGTRLLLGNKSLSEDEAASSNAYPLEIQVGKDYFADADGLEAANPVNIMRINLEGLNAFTSGEGSLELGQAQEGTRVDSKNNAQQAIASLDKAIVRINDYRSYLGAMQNRLGHTITNLSTQVENSAEARSRIVDTDFAEETARMTSANILQQAGTAVLSSANAQPQIALSLLSR